MTPSTLVLAAPSRPQWQAQHHSNARNRACHRFGKRLYRLALRTTQQVYDLDPEYLAWRQRQKPWEELSLQRQEFFLIQAHDLLTNPPRPSKPQPKPRTTKIGNRRLREIFAE